MRHRIGIAGIVMAFLAIGLFAGNMAFVQAAGSGNDGKGAPPPAEKKDEGKKGDDTPADKKDMKTPLPPAKECGSCDKHKKDASAKNASKETKKDDLADDESDDALKGVADPKLTAELAAQDKELVKVANDVMRQCIEDRKEAIVALRAELANPSGEVDLSMADKDLKADDEALVLEIASLKEQIIAKATERANAALEAQIAAKKARIAALKARLAPPPEPPAPPAPEKRVNR
ncbi:hypothetical protein HY625_00380 [Candidatus Uhrbacteria bacterium]|nr:hypothetical protein [Candidatus Uhrbacteria bacterium]